MISINECRYLILASHVLFLLISYSHVGRREAGITLIGIYLMLDMLIRYRVDGDWTGLDWIGLDWTGLDWMG